MAERYFPNILAVDPPYCGCMECLTGEYAPKDQWEDSATIADVMAVVSGEVGNNTFDSLFDLTLGNWSFSSRGTKEFVRLVGEDLSNKIDMVADAIDVDAIAERCE